MIKDRAKKQCAIAWLETVLKVIEAELNATEKINRP